VDLFDLYVMHLDGATVVHLCGELDLANSPRCRHALLDVLESSAGRVIVDLSELQLVDSTGIAALLAARRVADDRGRDLVLRDPQPSVARVLRIMQLETVLDVRHSSDGATAGYQ